VSPDIYPPFKGVTSRHYCSWTKWEGIEVSSSDAASSARVFLVKLCDKLGGIDVVPGFPGVMLYSISFPFDQVAKLPVHHLAVQNFLHNPFLFTVNYFWRRGRAWSSTFNWVIWGRSQLDNIEDWV